LLPRISRTTLALGHFLEPPALTKSHAVEVRAK
jgi:hypothetical protein